MVSSKKAKIIIVENEGVSLQLIQSTLTSLGYQVLCFVVEEDFLENIRGASPDMLLLNVRFLNTDCLEITRRLKADAATKMIPIVMMTAVEKPQDRSAALEAGADDILCKPIDAAELRIRVSSVLKIKTYNEHLVNYKKEIDEVTRRTEALKQSFEQIKAASLDTIFRLSRAAEYKDEDTGEHIQRMSHYSTAIARKMGLSEEFLENILFAAPMHDIGKIGIPDAILKKPGKLDDSEMGVMRQHTTMGADILAGSSAAFMKLAEEIAISHHEKWNGTGYPHAIKSTDIPIGGRIVALADVFDALTSERPYKKPMPLEKALAIIAEGRGSHFDPDMVDAFFAIKEEITASLNWWKFLSSDSTGEAGEQPLF